TAARRGDQATGSPPVERAPRDAASRDELGLSLQGDGARTGEIAGAIHDGVERRRDAEDAHQRRVVRRAVADAGAARRTGLADGTRRSLSEGAARPLPAPREGRRGALAVRRARLGRGPLEVGPDSPAA